MKRARCSPTQNHTQQKKSITRPAKPRSRARADRLFVVVRFFFLCLLYNVKLIDWFIAALRGRSHMVWMTADPRGVLLHASADFQDERACEMLPQHRIIVGFSISVFCGVCMCECHGGGDKHDDMFEIRNVT